MTRVAAVGPETGNATHRNVRQALVADPATAVRVGGSAAKANRAGIEVLVGGKKSLGEPVPSVAQIVYLVRPNRACVRERDQLHTCWREGVKTRQLTAGGGKGQRERLDAVTEEIAPGEMIVGVDLVIDLHNHAGQIVVGRRDDGSRAIGGDLTGIRVRQVRSRPWITRQQSRDHRVAE